MHDTVAGHSHSPNLFSTPGNSASTGNPHSGGLAQSGCEAGRAPAASAGSGDPTKRADAGAAVFNHYSDAELAQAKKPLTPAGGADGHSFGGFGGGSFGGGGSSSSWEETGRSSKPAGKRIEIQFMAFIPNRLGKPLPETKIGQVHGLTNQAQYDKEVKSVLGHWAEEPANMLTAYHFRTDDRDFGGGSYRLVSQASIDTSDLGQWKGSAPFHAETGESERAWADLSGVFSVNGHVKHERKKAQSKGKATVLSNGTNSTTFEASAAASYPFALFAPDIDISAKWTLTRQGASGDQVRVEAQGKHNNFPCYEVLVNGTSFYQYNTKGSGPGLWNLGFASTKFSRSGTF